MYLQSNGSFNSKGWNDNGEAPGLYLVVGAFFDKDSLPEKLAVEKCTKEQVLMCFKSYENHELLSYFD